MKDPRFIIGSIIILALAAFGIAEWQKVDALSKQIAELQEASAAQAAAAKDEAAKLQKQIEDRKAVITQMEEQRKTVAANAIEATDTAAPEGDKPKPVTKDFGSMMKKMFTDPSMKKMMRSTQMMGVKMMYSDLAKELGLNTDQANQVLELLGDRQMALTEKGMKMMGGDEGAATPADEVGKEVTAAKEEYDAQLESILGKDGMTKLNDYERTVGDRMQMQQYKQAFAANGVPLEEKESQGLLTIMKEERMKAPPSPLDPGAKDVGKAMEAMQSDEIFNKLMTDQEAADRRILSRARTVLSPDKMVQFEGIQKQQRDMQKMGIEMGRQFMKPK